MKTTHSGFGVSFLTPERRGQTCGYWFCVSTDYGTAHAAFDTAAGLLKWLNERGLKLSQPLNGPGESSRIIGSYRTEMHYPCEPAEVESMEGLHTMTLSNGDYVVAVITDDQDGIKTVHTLNPNVHDRRTFSHDVGRRVNGGNCASGGIVPTGPVFSA
jgi:hypothetical protein